MRKILILLLCLITATTATLLSSCDQLQQFLPNPDGPDEPTGPVVLTAPPLSIEGDVVSWTAVNGAVGYEVDIDGAVTSVDADALTVTLLDGQTVKVRAVGDGVDFSTGNWSDPITYTEPEPEIEYVTFTFKVGSAKVGERKVVKGELLSEEDIAYIAGLRHNGYGLADWCTDPSLNYSLDYTVPADMNRTLYGKRGNLAGVSLTWSYDTESNVLTISGDGPMFDFLYNDDAPWIRYKTMCEQIVFEGNVTTVGNNSFYEFDSLTDIYLPDSIVRIGDSAFYASSVSNIRFPALLTDIGTTAFYRCNNLQRLDFNEELVNIGRQSFAECLGLINIVLNDRIAELGTSAFLNCVNLESAYYVGTREQYEAIKIRLDNFWMNELANTYYISETKPDAPGPYWYYDEEGRVAQWYYTVGYLRTSGKVPFTYDYVDPEVGITQANIDFRNSIYYHGYQFDKWNHKSGEYTNYNVGTKLTTDLRFEGARVNGGRCGESLTWKYSGMTLTIRGTGAMWDFLDPGDAPWDGRIITNVVFEPGVNYIGSFAFSGITAIESLDIPVTITGVSTKMLSGCNNLGYIYYQGTAEQLSAVSGLGSLENSLDAIVYANNTDSVPGEGCYWRSVTVNGSTRIVAWELKDGVLTVGTAEKVIINFTSLADTPWYNDRDEVTKVVIRNGITTVGHYSFDGMVGVTEIVMPDTVQKISASAFSGTGYYTNEDSWTEDGALYISNHLIKVDPTKVGASFTVRDGTVSLADAAFDGCSAIEELILYNGLTSIYSTAYNGLTGLDRIMFSGPEDAYNTLMTSSGNKAAGDNLNAAAPDHTVYYYSKNKPTTEGNWWHYNQGAVEIWPAE